MTSLSNFHKTTKAGQTAYRAALGVALAVAFILVWMSLGIGIIGADGDPANLMYFGVIAVGIIGAAIARLQPQGMARALVATALAQVLVGVFALIAGLGLPWSGPAEISGVDRHLRRAVAHTGLALSEGGAGTVDHRRRAGELTGSPSSSSAADTGHG